MIYFSYSVLWDMIIIIINIWKNWIQNYHLSTTISISCSVSISSYSVFLVIKYAWEQYVNFRQLRRNLIKDPPPEIKKFKINHGQFILGQSYSFDKITFQMLTLSLRMSVDCLCIMCNVLPFIWENINIIFPFIDMDSEFQRALGFVVIESIKSKAIQAPLLSYQTFIIQKKYNFTNKTFDLFVYDLFVEGVLFVIIFPPILYGYLRVVQIGGQYFYVFLQVFALIITIVLTWIHPNLIAPLFNRFKELTNANLRMKIQNLSQKSKFPIKNIFIMNSSVRSAHLNAYFYGFGTKKVVVLYDTLLNSLQEEEIVSVVSHEIGHSQYRHSIQKLIVYLLQTLTIFYLYGFFMKNQDIFISFGFTQKSTFIGTALFFHLFDPLTSIFNTILLVMNRKFEFEADIFACKSGYGKQFKESLIKLFRQSTTMIRPDILYSWIKHSHPTIHERIQNIDNFLNGNKRDYEPIFQQSDSDDIDSLSSESGSNSYQL